MDEQLSQQIRSARGRFRAMVGTYGLGVFNDSFFRQAAILMAIAAGRAHMKGWIISIFTLPYLLLASQAGWLADRFPKRRVVIASKGLELAAMLVGAAGIWWVHWPLILTMVFLMAMQSCLFSPALNGSIPELYPPSHVNAANARLKVAVTVCILAGVSVSGVALGIGRGVVAVGVIAIALTGLGVSFGVPRRPAASPHARFPWAGPFAVVRDLRLIARDRLLWRVVAADVFVWLVGSVLLVLIPTHAMELLGSTEAMAGYLTAAQISGVAIGGVLSSRFAAGRRWVRLLPFGSAMMAATIAPISCVHLLPWLWRWVALFGLYVAVGIFGGLYLVPCEAFVQVHPPAERRGAVIAAANFLVFVGIFLSGPLVNLLTGEWLGLQPNEAFLPLAGACLALAVWLDRTFRRFHAEPQPARARP